MTSTKAIHESQQSILHMTNIKIHNETYKRLTILSVQKLSYKSIFVGKTNNNQQKE